MLVTMKLIQNHNRKSPVMAPPDPAQIRAGRGRKGEGTLRLKGGMWYFQFVDPANGGRTERACKTADYDEAVRKSQIMLGRHPDGPPGATVGELLDDYLDKRAKAATQKLKADPEYVPTKTGMSEIKKIREKLGHIGINHLTSQNLADYRSWRETAGGGVLFSTVNVELAYLTAAVKFAIRYGKAKLMPPYERPSEESQIREGFIERRAHYFKIFDALPDSVKAIFVCAFHCGCRTGELRKLRWSMVDFDKRIITLRAKTTKTKKGRYLPIWGDMMEVLQWQKAVRDRECPECEWVFFWHMNASGANARFGAKLGKFADSFKRAAAAAGLPGALFHDLRRSGIMYATQEAHIQDSDAMLMSGHRSRAVFDRYNIKGVKAMQNVGVKLDANLAPEDRGLKLVTHEATAVA